MCWTRVQQHGTDRANHDRLAKEKVDAKAALQRLIDALDGQVNNVQLNRPKNWEQVQKKLDEQRTSLEKKFNQLDLDIDMMFMDEASSNYQVTTMSSEKATTQQSLKDMDREKVSFEVRVDAFGKESEAKAKEVAKITNEVRVAEQGVKKLNNQMEQVSQALAELEHSTDEISQCAVAQPDLEKRQSSYLHKATGGICYESSFLVGYLKVKSLSTLMCVETADRH